MLDVMVATLAFRMVGIDNCIPDFIDAVLRNDNCQ